MESNKPAGFPFGQKIAAYENCTRMAKELLYPVRYAIEEGQTYYRIGDYKIVKCTSALWSTFFANEPQPVTAMLAVLNCKRCSLVAHGSLSDCKQCADYAHKYDGGVMSNGVS